MKERIDPFLCETLVNLWNFENWFVIIRLEVNQMQKLNVVR